LRLKELPILFGGSIFIYKQEDIIDAVHGRSIEKEHTHLGQMRYNTFYHRAASGHIAL